MASTVAAETRPIFLRHDADGSSSSSSSSLLGRSGLLPSVGDLVESLIQMSEGGKKDEKKSSWPPAKRRRIHRGCLRRALEVLVKFQGRAKMAEEEDGALQLSSLPPWDEISAHCFELRLKGEEPRADKIDRCLDRLKAEEESRLGPALTSVLRLLASLRESSPLSRSPRDDTVFVTADKLEAFFPFQCALQLQSRGDECVMGQETSNSDRQRRSIKKYSHFPAATFNLNFEEMLLPKSSNCRNTYVLPDIGLLHQTPGTGLEFLRIEHKGTEERHQIDIPPLELIADANGRFLRVPQTVLKKEAEKVDKPVTSTPRNSRGEARDIWDKIWEVEMPQRRTWEALGKLDPTKERPYLTELGAGGVHRSWMMAMENLRLVDRSTNVPELIVLSEEKLVSDIGYLMIGIASDTFFYDEVKRAFGIRIGTCLDGVTPESFQSYCREFLQCGTVCRRLESMCDFKLQASLSVVSAGLIMTGFLHGIFQYMQGYRTAVLNISRKKSLLQLSVALTPLASQMQFLGRLCKVDLDDGTSEEELPTGIQLLCYLFDRTLHINSQGLYFVLVSILRSSAEPYFRFLERWIFHGVCLDEFREFGLECHQHFLGVRNHMFWTSTFATTEFPLDSSICREGNFISEIQQQVYDCGKSLNLLKLCQPHHHLCTPVVRKQPHIQLLVSPIEQAKLKADCNEYVEHMVHIADERTISLRKQKELEEDAKKELLRVAHVRHKDQVERIRQHRKSVVDEENRRKRIVFEDLRDQVIAERKRKAEEKDRKLREDKMWMEFGEKKAEEEVRREEAARRDVEDHYRRMTEEAERREQRTRWKIRRLELRSDRIKFWRGENKKIQECLRNLDLSGDDSQKADLSVVAEEIAQPSPSQTNTWLSVRVVEDELRNLVLVLEDQESNIVNANVSNLSEFTADIRQQILSQNFASLSMTTQKKLLENVEKKTMTGDQSHDDVASSPFTRRSKESSSTKRKRPESFAESAGKRIDAETGQQQQQQQPEVYESLAAALSSKDDSVVRRRPKELTTIDGRKRPTSKSIEEVLYPSRFSQREQSPNTPVTPSKTEFRLLSGSLARPYATSFNDRLTSDKVEIFTSRLLPPSEKRVVDSQAFTPLTMLMENSILIPLRAQLSVVNKSVLNYLLVDARLMDHFRALRSYLLFHDGEFAHHLSCSLFSLIRDSASEVLNPAALSRIIENAQMSSTFGCKDPLATNVGFTLRGLEDEDDFFSDVFRCLRLGYTTEWPCNIILTQEVLELYGDIFQFLLQLKKAVWGLEQVYVDLKGLRGYESSAQVRKAHLMRHDMLNFVNVTQDYVKTQVLEVSWDEFEREIGETVFSVDSLYDAHMRYLHKAKKRCILNRNAKAVQKILVDIFNIIANFSCLLTRVPWSKEDEDSSDTLVIHPSFQQVEESYKMFQEYAAFLYSERIRKVKKGRPVVSKLARRGYEHHLNDLLLCLNFNSYYDIKTSN